MLDMDIKGYFNLSGFYEVFGNNQLWDVVFVNGKVPVIGLYDITYDFLAYVSTDENYVNFIRTNSNESTMDFVKKAFSLQIFKSKWKPVKSGFNGCGIYKMNTIKNASFHPEYICEWIGFHKDIYEQGFDRMYIARDWKFFVGRQGPSL
jgi:hypothetical protein